MHGVAEVQWLAQFQQGDVIIVGHFTVAWVGDDGLQSTLLNRGVLDVLVPQTTVRLPVGCHFIAVGRENEHNVVLEVSCLNQMFWKVNIKWHSNPF